MFPILHRLAFILTCISSVSTVYLYQYPLFHGCAFPTQDASHENPISLWGRVRTHLSGNLTPPYHHAPFRLLALGDPQLEGDTSLPDPEDGECSSLDTLKADVIAVPSFTQISKLLGKAGKCLFLQVLPSLFNFWRKQLDLFGNDYYLGHIYRTISRHTKPTHVTVLGDLLGSQWIDDEEFEGRGWRFWNRVFSQGEKVESIRTDMPSSETLGEDQAWARRIINIAGNHDVGYAGDMTAERVERFERVFGKANWEIAFQLPSQEEKKEDTKNSILNDTARRRKSPPSLRLIILNSLNLDTPALNPSLQTHTYTFINDLISRSPPVEDPTTGTILLTHLPLHKQSGTCVDNPFFDFHSGDLGNGIKEQNHLSEHASRGILEGIFGMSADSNAPGQGSGRNGIILTGHDHEGCEVYHYLPLPPHEDGDTEGGGRQWNATRWHDAASLFQEDSIPGIREVTVRSMMGDFGGNAGLLSAWFDNDLGKWRFAYSTCSLGVQHIWWAVHVLDLVTLGFLLFVCMMEWLDRGHDQRVNIEEVVIVRNDPETNNRLNAKAKGGGGVKEPATDGGTRKKSKI